MAQKTAFLENYTELEVIGRGNFGSATLVRAKDDNNIYVAKKVLLSGLSQKEADGAHMEVNLLRELKHPHIVEYRDSFVESNVLIIIMEYCEEGDLAHFIKKREHKGEPLEEKLVLNWFLQILLALEFVHRRKILHRDIKSSNIFLRSNGTVKLGDFGISRVLENTNEAAMTVVGTPYYMSPEVCENKPYTFKSDVWALGCVIYEMCTLKHAFSASNLLGLVYKIVREQNEPIPTNTYSQNLSTLVQKLLNKNVNLRPSIRDLFMEPLIQKTIEEFIRTDGQYTTMVKIPVKKTQLHKANAGPGSQSGNLDKTQVMGQTNSGANQTNETPQQRMARRKEEARKAEEEKMKAAAKESLLARNQVSDRKNKELHSNNPLSGSKSVASIQASKTQINANQNNYSNSPVRASNQYDNNQIAYQQQYGGQSQMRQSNMGYDPQANTLQTMASLTNASAFGQPEGYGTMQRGFMEQTNQSLNYSQSSGTLMSKVNQGTVNQGTLMSQVNQGTYQPNQFGNQYNNPNAYGNNGKFGVNNGTGASAYTIRTEMELPTGTNYGNTALYRAPVQDERPLPALQAKINNQANIAEDDEELYDEDFDEYDEEFEEYWSDEEDNDKRLTVKANQNDLVDVMKLYKEKLNIGDHSTDDDFRDTAQESMISQPDQMTKSQKSTIQNAALAKRQQQIDILTNRAKQDLGVKVFEEAYNYLKKHRQLNTPDKKIQEELGSIVGKKNLTHCFNIDQIIFLELESM